jgi:hypothetical protein
MEARRYIRPNDVVEIMKPGDSKRRRLLSAEERVLWSTVTKTIAPLRDSETPDTIELVEQILPCRADASTAKTGSAIRQMPPLYGLGIRLV